MIALIIKMNSEKGYIKKLKIVEMTDVTPANSPNISKTPYNLL